MILILILSMAGCQLQKTTPEAPLPPARSAGELVASLEARTGILTTLKARGTVELRWRDEEKEKIERADGSLLFYRPDAHPRFLLIGKYLGQEILELGLNPLHYWLAIKSGQEKRAYVGTTKTMAASRTFLLPPGRLLDLMALLPLPVDSTYQTRLEGEQELLEVFRPEGMLDRELLLDRRSGRVLEVRLFDELGNLVARSKLASYQALADQEPAVEIPYQIQVWLPQAHLELTFQRASSELRVGDPEKTFLLPDFAAQGLPVLAP